MKHLIIITALIFSGCNIVSPFAGEPASKQTDIGPEKTIVYNYQHIQEEYPDGLIPLPDEFMSKKLVIIKQFLYPDTFESTILEWDYIAEIHALKVYYDRCEGLLVGIKIEVYSK